MKFLEMLKTRFLLKYRNSPRFHEQVVILSMVLVLLVGAVCGGLTTHFWEMATVAHAPEDPLEEWSEASLIIWRYNSTPFYMCRNMSTNTMQDYSTNLTQVEVNANGNVTVLSGVIYCKEVQWNQAVTISVNVTVVESYLGKLNVYSAGNVNKDKQSYSYLVGITGTTYFMKNGTTGQIDYYSTNARILWDNLLGNCSGGGSIFVKDGTYLLDRPIYNGFFGQQPKFNITITGESERNTIFKVANAVSQNLSVSAGSGQAYIYVTDGTKFLPEDNIIIVDGSNYDFCYVSSINETNRLNLMVDGGQTFTLSHAYTTNTKVTTGNGNFYLGYGNPTYSNVNTSWTIQNLCLDGNYQNGYIGMYGTNPPTNMAGWTILNQWTNFNTYRNIYQVHGLQCITIRGSYNTIEGCTFDDCRDSLLLFGSDVATPLIGNKVLHNTFINVNATTSRSIELDALSNRQGTINTIVSDNTIDGGQYGIMLWGNVSRATVTGNTIDNYNNAGIALGGTTRADADVGCIVSDNTIGRGNGWDFYIPDGAYVNDTIIAHNTGFNFLYINLTCMSHCQVKDNIAYSHIWGYTITGHAGTNTISGNDGFATEITILNVANTTATTFVFNHNLAGTPVQVTPSFNFTGWTSWTWTATTSQVTITIAGTLPSHMQILAIDCKYIP
jgi:hypothetical protein